MAQYRPIGRISDSCATTSEPTEMKKNHFQTPNVDHVEDLRPLWSSMFTQQASMPSVFCGKPMGNVLEVDIQPVEIIHSMAGQYM